MMNCKIAPQGIAIAAILPQSPPVAASVSRCLAISLAVSGTLIPAAASGTNLPAAKPASDQPAWIATFASNGPPRSRLAKETAACTSRLGGYGYIFNPPGTGEGAGGLGGTGGTGVGTGVGGIGTGSTAAP